jgi:hypothetical protein
MEGAVWPPRRKISMITAVDQPISIRPKNQEKPPV